jgi:hypothetical protein
MDPASRGAKMNYLREFARFTKEFFAKYPAVLSGYIIYAYLFVAMIRLFLQVKYSGATLADAYDIFSALPFMWLLAVALVKVIDIRTKLHQSETQRMQEHEALAIRETQLTTLKEVVRGLQHHVNNPLAVISLSCAKMKRLLPGNAEALSVTEMVQASAREISDALSAFERSDAYEVQDVGAIVGAISMPAKNPPGS